MLSQHPCGDKSEWKYGEDQEHFQDAADKGLVELV